MPGDRGPSVSDRRAVRLGGLGRRGLRRGRGGRPVAGPPVLRRPGPRGPGSADASVGHDVVSFASNDYLGLTTHPSVVAAAHEALDRWGAGSGASRLVTGSRPVHHELEAALADWKGDRGGRRVPHRVRRQPVGAVGVRRRRRGRPLRRAQPRLDHRRVPAGPGRRAHRAPPRPRRPRRVAGRGDGPVDRGLGHRVLHGRGRRRPRRPGGGGRAATARCWCSTRPTPCSVPNWATPTGSTCCGSARCRRRSGRSAGSWPARPASSSCW